METNYDFRPIIVFAPSVLAGAEKVVITGTHSLFDLGLDPHLIIIKEMRAPHFAEHFANEFSTQIKITVVESSKAFDFSLALKINDIIKKEKKKTIVHTHGLKALVICQFVFSSAFHIHTHHGNTSHNFKMRIYEWMADVAMKRCDQIIAVSEEMKLRLLKTLTPYKNISVVPNMLSFKNADQIRAFRKTRSRNDKIHLIFIGRISPEKGLIPFLNNFIQFEPKKDFSISILGDGPEKELALSLVSEHHLESKIHFYGFVPNPSDYLQDADVLVLPSLTEGLPMTLIESLASGVPVVANDVGAIRFLLLHNQNGLLVADNQFEHWNKAFKEILANREKWQKYSLEEAEKVEEKYSAKRWGLKTKEIYEQLIL
jgi:glycosyltransferase involved in cell wall biosynthesis